MVASDIKACLFDVFGTVVDWRTSVTRDLQEFARRKGIGGVDWLEFAVEWRKLYQPSMDEVRWGGERSRSSMCSTARACDAGRALSHRGAVAGGHRPHEPRLAPSRPLARRARGSRRG